MKILVCIGAAMLTMLAGLPRASSQDLTFEVVSIKRNSSLRDGGGGGPRPGGRYVLTNIPTRSLISIAYDIPGNRIFGAPLWVETERYDVDAIGKADPSRLEARQMIRAVLRDRFKLAARIEQREMEVSSLVLARTDGRLGPGLRPAIPCEDKEARKRAGARPCGFGSDTGKLAAGGTELSVLTT